MEISYGKILCGPKRKKLYILIFLFFPSSMYGRGRGREGGTLFIIGDGWPVYIERVKEEEIEEEGEGEEGEKEEEEEEGGIFLFFCK